MKNKNIKKDIMDHNRVLMDPIICPVSGIGIFLRLEHLRLWIVKQIWSAEAIISLLLMAFNKNTVPWTLWKRNRLFFHGGGCEVLVVLVSSWRLWFANVTALMLTLAKDTEWSDQVKAFISAKMLKQEPNSVWTNKEKRRGFSCASKPGLWCSHPAATLRSETFFFSGKSG